MAGALAAAVRVAAALLAAGFAAPLPLVVRERPFSPPTAAARAAASSPEVAAVTSLWAMAMSRDLRRAALLRWRMPFSAARSRARTAASTCSWLSAAGWVPSRARRALVMLVRTAERTARLRMCLRSLERIRLRAERELATGLL